MKRIEFIAPVESMRGNLSGKQELLYAENNNPAFDAPAGRQYARNYQPRFIGAKRSSDNLKYFAVKTKSATLVSAASKMNMALTGGVGAIYAAILNAETMRARLEYAWKNYFHSTKTFRAFMDAYLRDMLKRKAKSVQIGRDSEGNIIVVGNPWNASSTASYIPEISEEVLVKFWLQLAAIDGGAAPIYFSVDGQKGIAFEDTTFGVLASNTTLNLLNLKTKTLTQEEAYITLGQDGPFVKDGATYVTEATVIVADKKYITSEESPE